MTRKNKTEKCELCGETEYKSPCSCTNEKPIKVRFCPKCKSTDVKYVFHLQNLFGLIPRMECNKCKNHAIDFPIVIVTKDELKKKGNKK